MSFEWTRRAFLRSTLGLPAGALLAACAPDDRGEGRPRQVPVTTVSRPIVRPLGAGAVRIVSPAVERPVAYVSMATRTVFVDADFRDRASWLLDAHISVSTWVWRIPLAGDSPRTPIPPGDERREFEELPFGAWDPSIEPAEGDVRIVRGRRSRIRIEIGCAPIQGTRDFLTGPALAFERSDGAGTGTTREDFGVVGSGRRTGERDCGGTSAETPIYTWACRD